MRWAHAIAAAELPCRPAVPSSRALGISRGRTALSRGPWLYGRAARLHFDEMLLLNFLNFFEKRKLVLPQIPMHSHNNTPNNPNNTYNPGMITLITLVTLMTLTTLLSRSRRSGWVSAQEAHVSDMIRCVDETVSG